MGGEIARSGMAYNRQAHPEERELAENLAKKSGGKYTVEQIEEQLRLSNVNGTDIGPATDIVVGSGEIFYDTGGNWKKLNDDLYLQQFAKLDLDVVSYIQAATDAYSWAAFPVTPSPDWSKTPTADGEHHDRFTGRVLDETGRYSIPIIVEGVSYSPKFLPCASAECIAVGANLDLSNVETLRYLKAADVKSLNDLSKILAVGAIVTSGGTAAALGASSNIPSLMAGYLKGDLSGSMTAAALSTGFESYASARGVSPDIAGKHANILTVMGAGEKGTDLFFYSKTVWRVSIRVNKIDLSPFLVPFFGPLFCCAELVLITIRKNLLSLTGPWIRLITVMCALGVTCIQICKKLCNRLGWLIGRVIFLPAGRNDEISRFVRF